MKNLKILKTLIMQRQNKIFAIVKEFEKYGGKAENCPVNWWGKNPNYPELYRLECQIDRYEAIVQSGRA